MNLVINRGPEPANKALAEYGNFPSNFIIYTLRRDIIGCTNLIPVAFLFPS